jgi:hypothetical protein
MKNFYRILKYDGKLIVSNWSLSHRFLKKFWKEILNAIFKYIVSFGKSSVRDIFVPWKSNKDKVEFRFYHIFSLKELGNLAMLSGFVVNKL